MAERRRRKPHYVVLRRGVQAEQLLDRVSAARAISKLLDPVKLSRVEQFFYAVRFPKEKAKALGVANGSPAMHVRRCYRDRQGRVVAFATSLHSSGRSAYRPRLARRSG